MSSTAASNGHAQIAPLEPNNSFPTPIWPSSRRTPSFPSSPLHSSSSSLGSSSFHDDSPLFSPSTPLRFSGIPFSWEELPGIPKQHLFKKKDHPSLNLLPLPPSVTPTPSKKFNLQESFPIRKKYTTERDPFFAALIECSKDDHDQDSIDNFWKGSSVTRTLSDRFGFVNLYTSCKRTCAVSDSIVHLPRSRT